MKKKLLVCIIAVMTMVMFVGCGDNGANRDNGANQNTAGQTQNNDGSTVNQENLIGEAKAKELALAKIDGATEKDIRDFELDKDNGRLEYDGDIYYEGMKYEFEIDAQTGEFLKWQEEKDYD